jgi:heat shock protein HtpX
MFKAYGLASHIAGNRLKSLFLLASFVLLLQALLYSFSLIRQALVFGGGDAGEIMARAWSDMAFWSPLGIIGAGVWFLIAWSLHGSMIAFATGSRQVTREHAPALYNALENLCISRGIPMPKLAIIETAALNAFASGLRQGDYQVTVTRGLLDTLDKRELEAVLGHELTHIRNRDAQMMVIAVIFAGIFAFVGDVTFRNLDFPFGRSPSAPSSSRSSSGDRDGKGAAAVVIVILIALAIIAISWGVSILIRLAFSRAREFMADAGSIELTKDPDAMISALRKISGHASIADMPSRMHAFFIETPAVRRSSAMFETHPPLEDRIDALVRFASGRDIQGAAGAPRG